MQSTASMLASRGVESFLFYDPRHEAEPGFLAGFAGAFPMVDVVDQVRDLAPDLVYVHRCESVEHLDDLASAGPPVLRFFHDHRPFCLREHKYTPLRHRTCTRTAGLGCYACPGFVVRGRSGELRLRTLSGLTRQQQASRRFRGWVVGSRYMAGHVARHGFAADRIHRIPLSAPAPEHEDRVGEPGLLLFAGQLIRGKGLDLLLGAMARTRHRARLIVAGEGAQRADLEGMVASLGLGDRVDFVGSRTRSELGQLYRRCSVVVVPSRAPETFGLVGLEALSHSRPVIASRVGGMDEWLVEGETGLGFDSGDVAGLAHAIDELCGDAERGQRMGDLGRKAYLSRFQPEHHAERLMELFTRTAGPRVDRGGPST